MTHPFSARPLTGIAVAAVAVVLAGCQSNTYGTGKSPGLQTIQDVVGIAALSNDNNEPIDYRPRPGIVAPPTAEAGLPPPVDPSTTAVAANWPVDPDEQTKKFRDEAAAREAAGLPTPRFSLPQSESTGPVRMRDPEAEALSNPAQKDEAKRLFADARGAVAVDETGAPIRRYLSDPPSEYRLPDPTAPLEIVDKPKKKPFKWWWQN